VPSGCENLSAHLNKWENNMHSITIPQRISLFALALLLCVATQAAAQAGHLDTTFANKGIFATTTGVSAANAIAIQSDGKIVVAGTGFANGGFTDMLIRLKTDGTLDASFGSGGIVNLVPGGNVVLAFGFFALSIQSDGKIVAAAAGASRTQPLMQAARVETNGSLDTSFGSGGFTSAIVFPLESGNLALQPDGKILVASGLGNPSQMARFTSTGQLDTNFGSSGTINLAYPGPTQIAVQPSGRILVASGEAARLVNQAQPAPQAGTLTRYNSNGTLDKTFGSSGTAASVASASALLLQSDGNIVVAGSLTGKLSAPPTANDVAFGIVRYSSNGAIDRSFGTRGVAIADFGRNAPVSGAFALAIQSNDDLVAAGAAGGTILDNKIVSSFGLTRFTSAGNLDTTFGSKGTVITTVASGQYSWVASLAIQNDGKIVAAGTSQFNTDNSNAYVARYLAQ
jgi:uncharacterized delta-60 repeat protein